MNYQGGQRTGSGSGYSPKPEEARRSDKECPKLARLVDSILFEMDAREHCEACGVCRELAYGKSQD